MNNIKYKYEVFGVDYYEVFERTSDTFDTLKEAKNFIENIKNSCSHQICKIIFKYEERNGEPYRYIKRIWLKKNNKWISTRKVYKKFLCWDIK